MPTFTFEEAADPVTFSFEDAVEPPVVNRTEKLQSLLTEQENLRKEGRASDVRLGVTDYVEGVVEKLSHPISSTIHTTRQVLGLEDAANPLPIVPTIPRAEPNPNIPESFKPAVDVVRGTYNAAANLGNAMIQPDYVGALGAGSAPLLARAALGAGFGGAMTQALPEQAERFGESTVNGDLGEQVEEGLNTVVLAGGAVLPIIHSGVTSERKPPQRIERTVNENPTIEPVQPAPTELAAGRSVDQATTAPVKAPPEAAPRVPPAEVAPVEAQRGNIVIQLKGLDTVPIGSEIVIPSTGDLMTDAAAAKKRLYEAGQDNKVSLRESSIELRDQSGKVTHEFFDSPKGMVWSTPEQLAEVRGELPTPTPKPAPVEPPKADIVTPLFGGLFKVAEPEIPSGMIRLYRGEPGKPPSWSEEVGKVVAPPELRGLWFTPDKNYALYYASDASGKFPKGSSLVHVDVPSNTDLTQWHPKGLLGKNEASGKELILPENLSKQIKRSAIESTVTSEPKGPVSAEERLGNIVNETIDQSNNAQKLGIRPGASSRSTDVVLGAPDLKSVSPKVEARWQAAVKEKPSVLDRVKVGAENAWKSVTREYADLPPRQYPQEIDILRRLRASPNASARQAADVLRGITINLGPKQYGVFSRVLALEDLVKDVESGKYGQGKELPFGYENADTLNADLAKFKSIADATPQITDALNKRRDFNDALKNTLVERGFLPKEVLDDPRYFHHQVLLYLAEKGGAGGPKSFRDWFSGWQKKRTGSALDYNRQYIEAEAEVVADAFKKIRMQDFQAEMKQASDLKPSLVDLHGKEWKQHIPKTHALWQPKKGNAFYPARTVAEKVMDQYLEGLRDILPEDFKEALVVGGKRQEWVVPKELAKVLDNLAPRNESWIERFAESANSAWKKFILLMPLRAIKYMANNVSGDLDFIFAANPKIFKEFKQAASDSWGFHEKGKAATGDIKEAVDMGVMGSGFRASELGDISRNDYFNWLTGEKPGLVDRYWNGIAKLNDAREDIGRLATYRFARKEFDAGRKFYGASVPRDIDALPTNKLKAAKVARELLIDYGRETEFGEYARRKVVPFYRWMHGNFARYIQLIKNIPEQEGAAGAGARLATVTGTKLAARMAFAYAAVNMWNHLMFPKEEEELGEGRNQLHLILGRDDQGNIQTLRFQGALSDLLGWVGGENLPQDIEDIAKGTASVGDKMEEAGEAAVSKAVNSSVPFAKTGVETLTKRSLYPNALKPSPIRDRGEHVAGLFGLKNVYKWISGKPHRPLRQEIAGLIAYTTDPGEAAYNATRHMAGEWLEDKGEDKGSFIPSKRSNALYFHKQALRYKDSKMAAKFLAEYEKLGGTEAGLNKSLDASEPLKMLGKRKNDFLESLSPQERATVQRAEEWYDRVLK